MSNEGDRTGGEAVVSALLWQGIHTLFALPGIQLDWVVDALAREPRITAYVPRHEQAITYMADGYARVSGRPGVGMVVPGPGVLNAASGLATAYACNSRVLLLAGQIHSAAVGKGYGNLHEIRNQSAVLDSLTKWSDIVRHRGELDAKLATAFAKLDEGRPRPVALELPYDSLEAKDAVPAAVGVPEAEPLVLDEALLESAAKLINEASFPILYVGGGAHAAAEDVKALAERLQAPVVASDSGRGCLPDAHALSFTSLGGRALFERADLAVVIGSRFMEVMTPEPSWDQSRLRYIYINIDENDVSAPRRPDVFLHADSAVAIRSLVDRVKARQVLTADQCARVKAWQHERIAATGLLADYVHALRAALPDDGILVNELTQVGYLARIAFEVRMPRSFIGPGYQGTLGYSFPTALGAAVASNGRRVFAITGDGGFGWSYQELATARRYDLPVTLVVFNDGYFGNVRAIQRGTFQREHLVRLHNPDFAQLAAAFSIPYARAESPAELEGLLRETVSSHGPVLVEAPVGELSSPWPLLRLKTVPGTGQDAPPADLL